MNEDKLKFIDLFAGIGGFHLGLTNSGMRCVYANEWDEKARLTYQTNFKNNSAIFELSGFGTQENFTKDIREVNEKLIPDFDVLTAGFPCQAFSIAGYREGFDDKKGRGNLFFDITRIIEYKMPKVVILENVKNLTTHDNGNTFKVIKESLDVIGYEVEWKIMNSKEYSRVPQNRERVYIVGFRKDLNLRKRFSFPDKVNDHVEIVDVLQDPQTVPDKYYYKGTPLYEKISEYPFTQNVAYQWRRKYIRENKAGVFPTLTANMGTGGHNVPIIKDARGVRKITPKECSLIQGFPIDYILPDLADSHLYKQFGNSVTVPVIESLARQITNILL